MIRILIVDDQNLVQQGIKSLLDRDLDFKVIGTVKDGRNAVQQIAQIHPDVVLLDIEMPGMDGITTTKYINRVSPKTKVIILSSHEEKKYVTQALMAGAKGYILKNSLMTDLKQAILAVENGYSQIDSRLLAKVFDPQNIKIKKARSDSGNIEANLDSSLERESQRTAKSWETNSSTLSSISQSKEKHQSKPAELSTTIQSTKPEVILSEAKVNPSEGNSRAKEVSDAVVLKPVEPNKNFSLSSYEPRRTPNLVPQTILAPARKKSKSSTKRNKRAGFNLLLKRKTLAIVAYWSKILDKQKRETEIDRLKSLLKQRKVKPLLSSNHTRKGNLLWIVGLFVLGIGLAIILSR